MEVTGVLEEVQVTPLAFHGVMNPARLPVNRIRKPSAFFKANINTKNLLPAFLNKINSIEFPGGLQT
jgi:hypothetical protein